MCDALEILIWVPWNLLRVATGELVRAFGLFDEVLKFKVRGRQGMRFVINNLTNI